MLLSKRTSYSDGEKEIVFHKSPLVESIAGLHSVRTTQDSNKFKVLTEKKIAELDPVLQYNLNMYGEVYADWLLIMDIATYISCVIYEETGKVNISFEEAMKAYDEMSDELFLYFFLGMSAWGFSQKDAEKLLNNPDSISERELSLIGQYISKKNINIFIRNVNVLKKDLGGILREYWENAFRFVWEDIEQSLDKTLDICKFECTQYNDCIQYLSNLHNDIYITDKQVYVKKGVNYMFYLDELKQFNIFPSVFSAQELLMDKFEQSLVIYYNLNLTENTDSVETPKQLLQIFKSLADNNRLRIINILWGAPATTQYLARELGLAQSTVSVHLKVLKNAGILKNKTIKKYVYYEINQQVLENISDELIRFAKGDQ